ncbi:MAG: DUF433 domain-containing protein [Opitutaceae bacterium]|nr:DUF433 domain-containing protein [Opitutaceae bacterium]
MKKSVVCIDPDILGGIPCFRGTRVPVQTLLDYLEAGDPLDEFLEDFPTVTRTAAITFLDEGARLAVNAALSHESAA